MAEFNGELVAPGDVVTIRKRVHGLPTGYTGTERMKREWQSLDALMEAGWEIVTVDRTPAVSGAES